MIRKMTMSDVIGHRTAFIDPTFKLFHDYQKDCILHSKLDNKALHVAIAEHRMFYDEVRIEVYPSNETPIRLRGDNEDEFNVYYLPLSALYIEDFDDFSFDEVIV